LVAAIHLERYITTSFSHGRSMHILLPRQMRHALPLLCAALISGGCSGSDSSGPSDPEWVELIGRSWTVASGAESIVCRRIQSTSDWYITGFRAVLPAGHARLIVTTSSSPSTTGNFPCDFSTSLAETRMIYSAGVGTGEIVFPSNVGIHISSGEYVTLMLQMDNQTVDEISGTTSVVARKSPSADVTAHADMTFAGTVNFNIADGESTTATGGCTAAQAWTVFALLPSLKKLGTHVKVTVTTNGVPQTLHDAPFTLTSQPFVTVSPAVTVAAGSSFSVAATWINNTGANVTYGPSVVNEWAFSGVYRYPASAPAAGAVLGCVS
jgi:hypothetical protein